MKPSPMTVTASGCGTSEHNTDASNPLLFSTLVRGVVLIVVVDGIVDVVVLDVVVDLVVVVDLDVVVDLVVVVDLDVVVGVVVEDVDEVVVLSQPNQDSVGLVSFSNGCANTMKKNKCFTAF